MKLKKLYISYCITALILTFIMTLFSYYAVGITEKSKASDSLEEYSSIIYDHISYTDGSYKDDLFDELKTEYSSKTRVVSLVLSNSNDMLNENSLEELRLAIGAEIISVSDDKGSIISSTDLYADTDKIREPFIDHINDSVYTESIISENDDNVFVVSATTRPDKKGLIQITYSADNIIDNFGAAETYSCIENLKTSSGGDFSIIDGKTYLYLINDTRSLENTRLQIPKEKFKDSSGKFSYNYKGEKSLIYYEIYSFEDNESYIILSSLPYSVINKNSLIISLWVFFSCLIVSLTLILYFRNSILKNRIEKSRFNG